MSAFCGELRVDGQSPHPGHAECMQSALGYWSDEPVHCWQEGPLSLLCQTPASAAAQGGLQPLLEDDVVLVGHIRLDDRAGLGHRLGVPDVYALSDERLLLLAWRRWGTACTAYLYGDWVCAIWDRRENTLWLGRDAAGNSGLYYWQDRQRLIFGTSLKAVLAHPVVPHRPALLHIARQLTVTIDPQADGSTPFEGISRLPGGHALLCSRQGARLDAWWRPELLDEEEWSDDEACYAAFRELYGAATEDRLGDEEGAVALMLSAGLDSCTVAALAAPRLAARGKRLLGFTAVPLLKPAGAARGRSGDESTLARAAAEHIGNIEFNAVAARTGLLTSLQHMLDIHDQALHGAANYHWSYAIMQQARARGARVMLTGQGGNGTVSWSGSGNLWPALARGDWRSTAAALSGSEAGCWLALKRQLLRPAVYGLQARMVALGPARLPPWHQYSAIHMPFAQGVGLPARLRELGHAQHHGNASAARDSGIARFRLGRLGSATLGSLWMETGAAHQMEVRDPTRDRRLIEFCWRVPDRIFWAGGVQRGLIQRGMRDSLPAAVLRARDKGLQAADLGHRVLAESAQFEETLRRLQGHALARECLDLARMHEVLQALRAGVTPATTAMAGNILLRGVATGLFLLRF